MYETRLLIQQVRDHLWMAYQLAVLLGSIGGPVMMAAATGSTMSSLPVLPVITHAQVDRLVGIADRALTLYEAGN